MNVHVITGEDEYLVSETAKKLVAGAGEALEVVDSANSTNAELQLKDIVAADASFSTPPFLDPVKATWWKNVGFLPCTGKGGPSEDVKSALEKFARKVAASPLPGNQVFVITGPRLNQNSIFAKTLKSVAEVVSFSSGKPWEKAREAASRVAEMAEENGFRFERGAAELFVARVGTDTRSLMGELAKLRDYLGGAKTATAADVNEIASPGVGVEPSVWEITDALGARDAAKAVEAVRRFELENGFAIIVTSAAERFFRQLVEMKDAEAAGRVSEATEGMAAFAVRKNLGFLRNWTLRELRAARARFMRLRERAVSTSGGADALIVVEIVRTCRRAAAGGAR